MNLIRERCGGGDGGGGAGGGGGVGGGGVGRTEGSEVARGEWIDRPRPIGNRQTGNGKRICQVFGEIGRKEWRWLRGAAYATQPATTIPASFRVVRAVCVSACLRARVRVRVYELVRA